MGYNLASTLYYRLLNSISDVSIPEEVADFRLLDEKVVRELLRLREANKFIRGLTAWTGFVTKTIEYTPEIRREGRTAYSFKKRVSLALDGMVSFSSKPLIYLFWIGSILCLSSFVGASAMLISHYFYDGVFKIWHILITLNVFIGGLILAGLGVVGLYISKIFQEVKQRPTFVVDEIVEPGLSSNVSGNNSRQ